VRKAELQALIVGFVREQAGLDAPGFCEFENLYIKRQEKGADGGQIVHFRYIFDEDGFSQYDKTITFEGYVTIDAEARTVASDLQVTALGVAAHYEPPPELLRDRKATSEES
jgi:hypothetical protein